MAEPYISQITIVSFNFPPKNWAFCNGQTLPINQNQALFALLGTTYGGNGVTTFALPNFQGRAPMHVGGGFNLGASGGEAGHTLIINELPTHNHFAVGTAAAADSKDPTGRTWGTDSANPYSNATPNATMGTQAVGNVGGSQAHPNLQPYLVLNFVIALLGVFPSRN